MNGPVYIDDFMKYEWYYKFNYPEINHLWVNACISEMFYEWSPEFTTRFVFCLPTD